MDGLTGNMENAGEPYKSFSWMKWDENELNKNDDIWKWVPFEQTAYWFDYEFLATVNHTKYMLMVEKRK